MRYYRAWCGDDLLDHHDAPRAVKHPQREAALHARYLIVVELHRVDGAAAEFVILREWAEDRGKEDFGLRPFWVSWHGLRFRNFDHHVFMLGTSDVHSQ